MVECLLIFLLNHEVVQYALILGFCRICPLAG